MMDSAGLAMHGVRGPQDFSTKGLTDGLMAKANPQHRNLACRFADKIKAYSGPVRVTGARGQDDALRRQCHRFLSGQGVVAFDPDLGSQLAKVMPEVVGETVIIIDEKEHGRGPGMKAPENAVVWPVSSSKGTDVLDGFGAGLQISRV